MTRSYRDVQASGMSELDRIRSQSAPSDKWLVFEAATAWVEEHLTDMEPADRCYAAWLAVEHKKAGAAFDAQHIRSAVDGYKQKRGV